MHYINSQLSQLDFVLVLGSAPTCSLKKILPFQASSVRTDELDPSDERNPPTPLGSCRRALHFSKDILYTHIALLGGVRECVAAGPLGTAF